MKKKIAVTRGSTNVFADLGYANSEEMLAKAQLVSRISDLIKQRRLTQSEVATLFGVDQLNVSRLLREGKPYQSVIVANIPRSCASKPF
jgi:predicted XRE-type DNA-binding protein